jgi:hypothetical protein
MATYSFVSITCITPSTGESSIATGVITAISSSLGAVVAGSLAALTGPGAIAVGVGGSVVGTLVGKGAGSVLTQIGQTFPDNLYVQVDGKKVWPSAKYKDINAGEIITPSIRGEFNHPIKITLIDFDLMSSDDNLGEFVINPEPKVNGFAFLVANPKEGDVYEVVVNIS